MSYKNIKKKYFTSQDGFGLIEVMLAAVMLGVLSLAVSNLIVMQTKEVKKIDLKQDVLGYKSFLMRVMNGDQCSMQFKNQVFNTNNLAKVKVKPVGNTIYSGSLTNKTSLIKEGESLSPGLLSYVVQSIDLTNFINNGNDSYKAELRVQFKELPDYPAPQPISMPLFISTDPTTPANAKKILGCGSESSLYAKCTIRNKSLNPSTIECCNSNELLLSFSAPKDTGSSSFEWLDKRCAKFRAIAIGNPVQLLCCP